MYMKSSKKNSTYLTAVALSVFLLTLILIPEISLAQTTSSDGSSEPTSVRYERLRSYRRQSSDLQKKIDALPPKEDESVRMPVLFGVGLKDIFPNFGDPRDGGARTHEGEDIMAVKGTPVVSPTSAVVLRTVNGTSEGLTVYTANPGGETFVYMHLSAFGEGVSSGDVLDPGALIGYVGNTGNASGGAAHLHFEIHSSGQAVDPFPRLTAEFTLQEKVTHLSKILTQTTDAKALAELLVANFRGTFTAAIASGITLPLEITQALASVPVTATRTSSSGLPAGDLDLGSSGSAVVALQNYLITAGSGVAAARLAGAGATGNFGVITQTALVEFQIRVGISPASGYYGAETRAFIAAHPLGTASQTPTPVVTPPGSTGTAAIARNLSEGMTGEDIRALQHYLNTHGYVVAASGAGSLNNESPYFGPATKAAVIKFQIAHAIAPAAGYVGPITRAALGSLK